MEVIALSSESYLQETMIAKSVIFFTNHGSNKMDSEYYLKD